MYKVTFDIVVVATITFTKKLRLLNLVYSTSFFTCHFGIGLVVVTMDMPFRQ